MKIFILLLVCWSVSNILVNGSILNKLRIWLSLNAPFFYRLLSCVTCCGFWVGILMYLLLSLSNSIILESINIFQSNNSVLNVISFGFLSSGISFFMNSLITFFISEK